MVGNIPQNTGVAKQVRDAEEAIAKIWNSEDKDAFVAGVKNKLVTEFRRAVFSQVIKDGTEINAVAARALPLPGRDGDDADQSVEAAFGRFVAGSGYTSLQIDSRELAHMYTTNMRALYATLTEKKVLTEADLASVTEGLIEVPAADSDKGKEFSAAIKLVRAACDALVKQIKADEKSIHGLSNEVDSARSVARDATISGEPAYLGSIVGRNPMNRIAQEGALEAATDKVDAFQLKIAGLRARLSVAANRLAKLAVFAPDFALFAEMSEVKLASLSYYGYAHISWNNFLRCNPPLDLEFILDKPAPVVEPGACMKGLNVVGDYASWAGSYAVAPVTVPARWVSEKVYGKPEAPRDMKVLTFIDAIVLPALGDVGRSASQNARRAGADGDAPATTRRAEPAVRFGRGAHAATALFAAGPEAMPTTGASGNAVDAEGGPGRSMSLGGSGDES